MIALGLGSEHAARKRQYPILIEGGGGGVGYRIDDLSGSLHILDDHDLSRYVVEKSPTIAAITAVVARLFRVLRLDLARGTGQEVVSHPLLDLLNARPNEIDTASGLWADIAEELVHGGEAILRVQWDGRTPRRVYLWPYNQVSVEPYAVGADLRWVYRYTPVYRAGGLVEQVVVKPLADEPPGICHVRMNNSRSRPMRAESPWRGLESEVVASIHAAAYRAEYFRQGGSPRLVAQMAPPPDNPNIEVNIDSMRSALDRVYAALKAGPSTWMGGAARSIPEGAEMKDFGPQHAADPVLTMPARAIDEKLAAAAGLPVIVLGNMERSTYANARTQMATVVRDAIQPRVDALLSALSRDILIPMGGRHARLVPSVDTDRLVKDEARVFNDLILARHKSGVITVAEAREAFGYEPAMPEDPNDGGDDEMMDREDEDEDDDAPDAQDGEAGDDDGDA